MSDTRYELVIIGGGAAAFAAAFKAEAHGVKTAMIERGLLGGTCINVGCVPSKNLLGAGEIIHSSRKPTYSSIVSCEADFDFSETIANKDKLVKNLRKQKYYDVISPLENVELIEANASFVSDKKLKINNKNDSGESKILEADKFIIATGSSPSIPPLKGIEKVDYLTNNEVLSLKETPTSMIVIGGRALGLEFAQMYSRFGTRITLLQRGDRIIPDHEPEISYGLHQYLVEEEIEIVTEVEIKEVYQKNGIKFVNASVNDGTRVGKTNKIFEAEQLLMATGRKPNTTDLHLENAGVKTRDTDGSILVNSQMHTNAPNIWAGGDVDVGLCSKRWQLKK
jgi:mercuric reductase